MKSTLIVILSAAVVVLTARLVYVENKRYALQVGMCRSAPPGTGVDYKCLATVETRTSWLWHLYFALKSRGVLLHVQTTGQRLSSGARVSLRSLRFPTALCGPARTLS
jgi:hypothetical protein